MGASCSCCPTMERAIQRGHDGCLARADRRSSCGQSQMIAYMQDACVLGHLGCLRYLLSRLEGLDRGHASMTFALICAVSNGRMDCIRYLHEQAVPWASCITSSAAMSGRVDVLAYVSEQGAPWCSTTTAFCCKAGGFECLKYAHGHGATLSKCAVWRAATFDLLDCLEFLVLQGCAIGTYGCLKRHRDLIGATMSRRRAVVCIQRGWRYSREVKRRRAAHIIEDAYITWACRPGTGSWYKRAHRSLSFSVQQDGQDEQHHEDEEGDRADDVDCRARRLARL